MYYILSLLMTGMGIFMILKPESWFRLVENWKQNSAAEPSEDYLSYTRFGGTVFALVGIGYIVFNLFL